MSELIKKKLLFIKRDGVIISGSYIKSFEEITYLPHLFEALRTIIRERDYELILVSNQPGVGTPAFPMELFFPVHNKIIDTLEREDIVFSDQFIDFSLSDYGHLKSKSGQALIDEFKSPLYDLSQSYFIGNSIADMEFAKRLGTNGILLTKTTLDSLDDLNAYMCLKASSWLDIASLLTWKNLLHRSIHYDRKTKETQIEFTLDIDGCGKGTLVTGIGFFDHMLEQIFRHARFDIKGSVHGDLEVDEHHTVEDVAISLGEAINKALDDKRGISRYGYDIMMMDDVVARVAIDFSSRPDLIFNVKFKREEVGGFPTEMFYHFFKSFTDSARCNLFIEVTKGNTHHQAEAAFKAFAHALRNAVKRIPGSNELPSTKGVL